MHSLTALILFCLRVDQDCAGCCAVRLSVHEGGGHRYAHSVVQPASYLHTHVGKDELYLLPEVASQETYFKCRPLSTALLAHLNGILPFFVLASFHNEHLLTLFTTDVC